jgi:hypothetical protein
MLRHARLADEAGLDVVSVERLRRAGGRSGRNQQHHGTVIVTNLLSRPAPILARTVTGLSAISGGRVVLGIGAGGMWEEIVALGVPACRPQTEYERWKRRS